MVLEDTVRIWTLYIISTISKNFFINRYYYMVIKFVKSKGTQLVNDTHQDSMKFYQIGTFSDPNTRKYPVRKFVLDGNNNFVDIRNYRLSFEQLKKFMSKKRETDYKLYSTYTLEDIPYPNNGEICLARSPILCEDPGYSGYAMF